PLDAVRELARHGHQIDAAGLLEIRVLRDLHAVAPDFPAQAPRSQGRRLPVVLDKANIVARGIEADRAQRIEVQVLDVQRRRLEADLELIVGTGAVRVLAVATVGGSAAELRERGVPWLGTQHAQERRGMERTRADLD